MQVKWNQKTVYEELESWLAEKVAEDEYDSFDEQRNRQEYRSIEVFTYNPLEFDLPDGRDSIEQIVRCIRKRKERDTKNQKRKESLERSYYVSTSTFSAQEYMNLIRGHRSIENKNHNVRDWSYEEDKSRIRKNPGAIAILRSMSLNILRSIGIENITQARKENGFSLKHIFKVFGKLLT